MKGQRRTEVGKSALATLLAASSLTVVAAAIVAPALPAMRDHFSANPRVELLVRLVLVTPPLFIVIGSPVAGWIADRLGRKPLLLVSTVLYAAAGSSGAWLREISWILVGRALLGLSVAGTMTAATTFLADVAVGAGRRWLMGLQAAAIGSVGALFLVLGGFVAGVDWRSAFLLYLLAIPLLPPMVRTLREPSRRRSSEGRLPLGRLAAHWLLVFVGQVVFYLAPVHLPFFLRELGNPGPLATGLCLGLLTFSYATSSIVWMRAPGRADYRPVFATAFAVLGASYLWIGAQRHWPGVLPGLAAAGFGLGMLIPNAFARVAELAPERARGRAMGSITTFVFLGQFVAPLASAPIAADRGLGATFACGGGLALAAAAALLLRRHLAFRGAGRGTSRGSRAP